MDAVSLSDASFRSFPCHRFVSEGTHSRRDLFLAATLNPLICRRYSTSKRNFRFTGDWLSKSRSVVFSTTGDSNDTSTDVFTEGDGNPLGRSEVLEIEEDELMAARRALSEAQSRQEAIQKERDQLLEELARSEAKQQEYMTAIMHDKELAIAELEAAKALFLQNLQESVEDKFNLESKLVLAKQDAVELAVQVEKLAEVAFQQATAHIIEDAQLRISVAETSAAEAAYWIEEQIWNATESTVISIVQQSKDAIEKALAVAETAGDHTARAVAAFAGGINPVDEIGSIQAQNIKLQNTLDDLKSQLSNMRNESDRLKLELEQSRGQANAFQLQANDAEKALLEFQESSRKKNLQQEEEVKSLMEKLKKDSAEKRKTTSKAFKVELEAIKAAIEAAKQTAHSKDEAYMRRCDALQRSLKASEDASKIWRQRAEIAVFIVERKNFSERDEEAIYVVNGGRIDLLTDDGSH